MFRAISVGLAISGVLVVGALTAVAANAHGRSVSGLATSTTRNAEANGDAVSALASAKSDAKSDVTRTAVRTVASTRAADSDVDGNDEAADAATGDAGEADNDQHGDAVSAVAKSDATAAHENGKKKVNHGGAVSEAAEKD